MATTLDTYSEIASHVQLYETVEAELTELNAFLYRLQKEQPKRPEFIETPEQWENYSKTVEEYNIAVSETKALREQKMEEYKTVLTYLKVALPNNVWFRVLTENGERWIGIQTDDWGGHSKAVVLSTERPEQPLKHKTAS